MTLAEAIEAALRHPSPAISIFRQGSDSKLVVVEDKTIGGRIIELDEIYATDWELFDIYRATA